MSGLVAKLSKSNCLKLSARITNYLSVRHLRPLRWGKSLLIIFILILLPDQGFSQEKNETLSLSDKDFDEIVSYYKTKDPSKAVERFKSRMPLPVIDNDFRQKIIDGIPKEFEKLRIKDPELEGNIRKLLLPVFSLYDRADIYEIRIFKHKKPAIIIDSGVVILISSGLLIEALSEDEILGLVAHEIGHEFYFEYSVNTKHFSTRVKELGNEPILSRKLQEIFTVLELQCDAFAALTLAHLGYNPIAFIDGIERALKKFPEESLGYHPPNEMRRMIIEKTIVPSCFESKNLGQKKKHMSLTLIGIKERVEMF